ncbi:hypothetical protein C2S52_010791 [Perilla frutescens var. hirtella]|nr:hypothetical protein C2S52_010791 [Perilla frutescens var. hirtella]
MAPSESSNMYVVTFFDDNILTTVTHDPEVVSEWISEVEFIHRRRLHRLIVGLDVEWVPSFDRHCRSPVATLQLCVGRRCLIYQISRSPCIPQTLADFLLNESYTFTGVGVESDLEKLENDYGIGGEARCVDLGKVAAIEYGRKALKNVGLKGLASVVLEREMEKPQHVTLSRWDNWCLTEEQVHYASVDAFVSFEIGRILGAWDY